MLADLNFKHDFTFSHIEFLVVRSSTFLPTKVYNIIRIVNYMQKLHYI